MTWMKDVLEIKISEVLKIVHSYSLSLDRNYQFDKQAKSVYLCYIL